MTTYQLFPPSQVEAAAKFKATIDAEAAGNAEVRPCSSFACCVVLGAAAFGTPHADLSGRSLPARGISDAAILLKVVRSAF